VVEVVLLGEKEKEGSSRESILVIDLEAMY
jgi:hypothetical protein